MFGNFFILMFGLLMMFVFMIAEMPLLVFVTAFLTIYFIYRKAMKQGKEYLSAVEEVSKEVSPDLYAIVKEKTKHLK